MLHPLTWLVCLFKIFLPKVLMASGPVCAAGSERFRVDRTFAAKPAAVPPLLCLSIGHSWTFIGFLVPYFFGQHYFPPWVEGALKLTTKFKSSPFFISLSFSPVFQVWRFLNRPVRRSRLPTCNANLQRERAEVWVFCDVLFAEQVGRLLKEELRLSGSIFLSVHRLGRVFSM